MSEDLQPGTGPGQWSLLLHDPYGSPRWVACIRCLKCRKPLVLLNHTIEANGQVSPSVGHPEKFMPCDWHPTPRLVGWVAPGAPGALPIPSPPAICTCEHCGAQSREIGGWGTWSGGTGIICKACIRERSR